jgi:opacity protein-like surface antigen
MKKLLLAAVLFTAMFTSCKKESNTATSNSTAIELGGTIFKGNVTFRTNSFDNSILTFKTDGALILNPNVAGLALMYGSWGKPVNSNIVNITITNSATSIWKGTGTINTDGTKIENGTLTQIECGGCPSPGTGTFSVTKE